VSFGIKLELKKYSLAVEAVFFAALGPNWAYLDTGSLKITKSVLLQGVSRNPHLYLDDGRSRWYKTGKRMGEYNYEID
jgi:hypothetical protein